jgi:uncharacterized protein YlaI
MSVYGCNNCHSVVVSSTPQRQEQLSNFYVQNLAGAWYLIALCRECQQRLFEVNEKSLSEGLNFIQKIVSKNAYR